MKGNRSGFYKVPNILDMVIDSDSDRFDSVGSVWQSSRGDRARVGNGARS